MRLHTLTSYFDSSVADSSVDHSHLFVYDRNTVAEQTKWAI